MNRALVGAALALGCASFGGDARAAGRTFGSLPEGEIGFVPSSKMAPARIDAGEKAPGFVVAPPPKVQLDQMKRSAQSARWVFLFSNEEDATKFSGAKGFGMPAGSMDTCFTTADRADMFSRSFEARPKDPPPVEWPSFFEARPTLRFGATSGVDHAGRSPDVPSRRKPRQGASEGGVIAVHQEKLARSADGAARLEMADAWVDPETHGARLIAARSIPLERIATAPSGIEVFAARNHDEVELVVTGSRAGEGLDPAVLPFLRQFARLSASLGESRAGNSDCGHIRIALHPDAEKGTPMSVVQTVALLPALEPEAKPSGAEPTNAATAQMDAFKVVQAMRKRPVTISLSATRSTADAEPILSVAIAWAGREERR